MANILVIEDQDSVRRITSGILTEAGHAVRAVPDGDMGVKACAAEEFDLVVTDIIMPKKQGFDTIVEIRQKHPAVKILAVSGGGQGDPEGYLQISRQLGAHATLAKPFSPEQLTTAVNSLLTKRAR
jgi:DNA-binding response OmpR family regulator